MTSRILALALLIPSLLLPQKTDIAGTIAKPGVPVIAVPDFRGSGDAQRLMGTFNQTLWNELSNSGFLKMAPKTMYPLQTPQQSSDLRQNNVASAPKGARMADWSGPPVNANYLAFGYTAAKDGQLALFGWLYNVSLSDISGAQVIGKIYVGSLDENGARKVAREFAADILQQLGGTSLIGTKIIFVSNRTGNKEIWQMDYDGSNQKQITRFGSISITPAISPDGTRIAFMSYARGTPRIMVFSLDTGRQLAFYNQQASLNTTPSFTPDSKQILFSSTLGGGPAQLYVANADGGNLRRISRSDSIEVEPKANPKTGAEIVFVSGRTHLPQIYRMNMDGADVSRLTDGQGEATNPAWSPDGRHVAFAWTRGFDPGAYNVFVMDVASGSTVQLTHGDGRNENPTWAPDGIHIAFAKRRGRSAHIWTMLADGTQQRQLTTQASNEMPVWGKSTN